MKSLSLSTDTKKFTARVLSVLYFISVAGLMYYTFKLNGIPDRSAWGVDEFGTNVLENWALLYFGFLGIAIIWLTNNLYDAYFLVPFIYRIKKDKADEREKLLRAKVLMRALYLQLIVLFVFMYLLSDVINQNLSVLQSSGGVYLPSGGLVMLIYLTFPSAVGTWVKKV